MRDAEEGEELVGEGEEWRAELVGCQEIVVGLGGIGRVVDHDAAPLRNEPAVAAATSLHE